MTNEDFEAKATVISNITGRKNDLKHYMHMYTIHDITADTYDIPMVMRSDVEALRMFRSIAQNEKSTVSQYLEEFELIRLGHYDTATADILVDRAVLLTGSVLKAQLEVSKNDNTD